MGYYILGIIIFLLLVVFISDLVREAKNGEHFEDLDLDRYYRNIANPFPGQFDYYHEFADDVDIARSEPEEMLDKAKDESDSDTKEVTEETDEDY